jgi:hypothetical protein
MPSEASSRYSSAAFWRQSIDSVQHPVAEELGIGLYEYKETSILKIARIIETVVASILPLCSVIVLYVLERNAVRLGMIVLFSALFSLALALMTNTTTINIFVATSA